MKKTRESFITDYGMDYLNLLLNRIKSQKEYSKINAPDQIELCRKQELIVRKCIEVADDFSFFF